MFETTVNANRNRPSCAQRGAFSLLEVVVAVGIFAVGMLAVVGMFTPVARSVGDSSDAEAAVRVADALRAKLQTMTFPEVAALLKGSTAAGHVLSANDARSDYNPATDPQILFASRDGSKVGANTDPIWHADAATGRASDRDQFFEIALIRNEAISPQAVAGAGEQGDPLSDPDATACLLAYTARIRWPAFAGQQAADAVAGDNNSARAVSLDHSMKQVMFFTGSTTR